MLQFSIRDYNKLCFTSPNFTVLTLVSFLRISGALLLHPLYAFMAWAETDSLNLAFGCLICERSAGQQIWILWRDSENIPYVLKIVRAPENRCLLT